MPRQRAFDPLSFGLKGGSAYPAFSISDAIALLRGKPPLIRQSVREFHAFRALFTHAGGSGHLPRHDGKLRRDRTASHPRLAARSTAQIVWNIPARALRSGPLRAEDGAEDGSRSGCIPRMLR